MLARKRTIDSENEKKKHYFSYRASPSFSSFPPQDHQQAPPRTKFIKKQKPKKAFDPSKYNTRLIALKFAYLGQRYNGFEHHTNNTTPLPTIEEELFKALTKTRLIFPTRLAELKEGEIDWEGTEYSKCGRTDRGVSAFGQVIGIRVRSNRPTAESLEKARAKEEAAEKKAQAEGKEYIREETQEWDPVKDELSYIQLLNRVLPEDIRVLAWCPNLPEDFSARFSCRERRYRYFFTQPAYAPVPGRKGMIESAEAEGGKAMREGWLDIEAMQDAAKRYEGLHDFRNFCKVDPAKQITNFERRIFHASVTEVPMREGPVGYVGKSDFAQWGATDEAVDGNVDSTAHRGGPPKVYTFNVNGSAFLWHQVRHLVAVIFLVGQGLEPPSIVSDLLDVEKNPTRPKYEMATDAPLVLWDCIFPKSLEFGEESQEDVLEWIYVGDNGGRETNKSQEKDGGDGKYGRGGIMDDLWQVWRQRKIDEVLAGSLLDVVAAQGKPTTDIGLPPSTERSVRVYDGGNWARPVGKYIPVMEKSRMETVDVINARYAERKGFVNGKKPPKEPVDPVNE